MVSRLEEQAKRDSAFILVAEQVRYLGITWANISYRKESLLLATLGHYFFQIRGLNFTDICPFC
jgi:hypothetical protein